MFLVPSSTKAFPFPLFWDNNWYDVVHSKSKSILATNPSTKEKGKAWNSDDILIAIKSLFMKLKKYGYSLILIFKREFFGFTFVL